MTQEAAPKNGGWEKLFLDALTPEQREQVRYVQGLAQPLQVAMIVAKLVKIETVLDNYTAKQLLAQATATERALQAAQPVIVTNGKGNWTISAAQRGWFVAAGGALVAGAVGAAKAMGLL